MEERIKNRKGFIPIPLILGIIFILLLGGVGLGVVKTNEKISNAISEAQRLEKEKNYDESIQKLEELENSFLVRHFGFRKEEIEIEIEKNKRLLEESQMEAEEEITPVTETEEGEIEEEKEEETTPVIVDCGNDLDCLITTAENCTLAKLKDTISVEVGGYIPTISFFAEIRGKDEKEGKCVFYVKAEKLIDLEKEGMSKEEIEIEKQMLRPFIEGAEELCFFRNEDLVEWLETIKEGKLPSFEGAECMYHGFDLLRNY